MSLVSVDELRTTHKLSGVCWSSTCGTTARSSERRRGWLLYTGAWSRKRALCPVLIVPDCVISFEWVQGIIKAGNSSRVLSTEIRLVAFVQSFHVSHWDGPSTIVPGRLLLSGSFFPCFS
jgi:hypothetical protein